MNIRLSIIVLFFAAYSFHINAKDAASDVLCEHLPTLNFNVTVNYVQDEQIEETDLPFRNIKRRGGSARTGDYHLDFQNNNDDDVIINITRQNPYTWEREEVQILDDTGLFPTYLSGLTLVSKLKAGQPTSEKDIEILKSYLDKLNDMMNELSTSFFSTNHAQNSVERIYDILDTVPINAHHLYTELHRMTYLSTELDTTLAAFQPNNRSAIIQGYIRSKEENGQWGSWSIYRGPKYWHSEKRSAGGELNAVEEEFSREKWKPTAANIRRSQIPVSSQFFVALLERARTDDGAGHICSPALARSSIGVQQPMVVGYKRS